MNLGKRKKGRDKNQRRKWEKNHKIILQIIENYGGKGIRVKEIGLELKKLGMNPCRTTIHKHLRCLKNERAIAKFGRRYYSYDDFLRKKLEKQTESFKNSLKPLDMRSLSKQILQEIILERTELKPRPTAQAERRLWMVGTNGRIWCEGLNFIDDEVATAMRNLIEAILRNSKTKTLTKSKIFVELEFDLSSAIEILLSYHSLMYDSISQVTNLVDEQILKPGWQASKLVDKNQFLEMIQENYEEAARQVIETAKKR